MEYIIKTFSKSEIPVTKEQLNQKIIGKAGLVYLDWLDRWLNVSAIEQIIRKSDYEIEKSDKNVGYAREDGAKFVKRFGVWKCAENTKLIVDMNYYRSVAEDDLISEEEYKNQKLIKGKNVKKLLNG